MCYGIFHGARTLLWSSALIFVTLYPCAIILRTTLGEANDNSSWRPDIPPVTKNFETVFEAWFTCFRCALGDCADEAGRPIFAQPVVAWHWRIAYCCTTILFVFGIFNVIVGIYVENTVESGKHSVEMQRQRRLADRNMRAVLTKALVDLFAEKSNARFSTCTNSVTITSEAFHEVIERPETQGLLDQLDIAEEDRLDLFEILDADGKGTIGIDELVNGMLKLRGPARRSDIVACRLVLASLQDQLHNMQRDVYKESVISNAIVHDVVDVMKKAKTGIDG